MEINKYEKIDNVREWMEATAPTEPAIPDIDPALTFRWLILHMGEIRRWQRRLPQDTAPRGAILEEAVRRQICGMRRGGVFGSFIHELVDEVYEGRDYPWDD